MEFIDAIKCLINDNEKIRNINWPTEEFVYIKDNVLLDESGFRVTWNTLIDNNDSKFEIFDPNTLKLEIDEVVSAILKETSLRTTNDSDQVLLDDLKVLLTKLSNIDIFIEVK